MSYKKELWGEAQVRCPFYITHERRKRSIVCEGHASNMETVSRFHAIDGMNRHLGIMCCHHFERCPVYKIAYKKYED